MELNDKLEKLISAIKATGGIVVAFSGGVDSTFLLKVAYDVLQDKAVAVTARSSTYPLREFREASGFAEKLGVKHIIVDSEELDIEGFSDNPVNRCYFCKKELFTKLRGIADNLGIKYIADGTNADDINDYRPGMTALGELSVLSPLKEAGLTKDEIRKLSMEMSLPTWDKPAFACLASRFPYGSRITREKLEMVDKAEQCLIDQGFRQVRVRCHGDVARIEVAQSELEKFFNERLMAGINNMLNDIGFKYAALDLKGYRTGSMNEGVGGAAEP